MNYLTMRSWRNNLLSKDAAAQGSQKATVKQQLSHHEAISKQTAKHKFCFQKLTQREKNPQPSRTDLPVTINRF